MNSKRMSNNNNNKKNPTTTSTQQSCFLLHFDCHNTSPVRYFGSFNACEWIRNIMTIFVHGDKWLYWMLMADAVCSVLGVWYRLQWKCQCSGTRCTQTSALMRLSEGNGVCACATCPINSNNGPFQRRTCCTQSCVTVRRWQPTQTNTHQVEHTHRYSHRDRQMTGCQRASELLKGAVWAAGR